MPVTGNEGAPIADALAQTWISNFIAAYPNDTNSYLFGMNIINNVKNQTGYMGMRFYNALDTASAKTIIIYGVNSNGDGITTYIADYGVPCPPTPNCTMACTGNEGAQIASATAVTWINSFKTTYPNEIWAHLYGKNILANVFNQSGCVGIRVHNALDQGVKKIIVYGVNSAGVKLTTYIAEYSVPCPTMCGKP